MAYTRTQFVASNGASHIVPGVAAGSLLVMQIHTFDDTTTISSLTDTQGNTWTIHGVSPATAATGERVTIASAPNAVAGSTTITITRSSGSVGIRSFVYEWGGFGAASPFHSSATAENAASANPSWNLTAVPAGALIVGGMSTRATGILAGADYTKEIEDTSNWRQYSQYDLAAGVGGTVAFDMTAASASWTGIAAAFNTAPATFSRVYY